MWDTSSGCNHVAKLLIIGTSCHLHSRLSCLLYAENMEYVNKIVQEKDRHFIQHCRTQLP